MVGLIDVLCKRNHEHKYNESFQFLIRVMQYINFRNDRPKCDLYLNESKI